MRTFEEKMRAVGQRLNESPVSGGFQIQHVTGFFDPRKWASALNEFRRLMKNNKYRAAYRRLTRIADFHAKRLKNVIEKTQKKPLACGDTGCDHCCRVLLTTASRLEASVLRGNYKRLSDEDQAYVDDRAREEEKILNRAATILGWPDGVTRQNRDAVADLYTSIGGRCIFLGRAGDCLIYQDRPWTCRIVQIVGPRCVGGQMRQAPIHYGLIHFLNSTAEGTGEEPNHAIEIIRAMSRIVIPDMTSL
jgi:Fe-S-cluster containining protein